MLLNDLHCCVIATYFPGDVVKVAVVFNSLSRLLLWKSSAMVCTLLNQLYSNSSHSQEGNHSLKIFLTILGGKGSLRSYPGGSRNTATDREELMVYRCLADLLLPSV